MTEFFYTVSTNKGEIFSGQVMANDKQGAVTVMAQCFLKLGLDIETMLGPYSREEMESVKFSDLEKSNMNEVIRINESQLRKLVSECMAGVINEIGDTTDGLRKMYMLAGRQDNKSDKLANIAFVKGDSQFYIPADKMHEKSRETLNAAMSAIDDKLASGDGIEDGYLDAMGAYLDYRKTHNPNYETLRPSDMREGKTFKDGKKPSFGKKNAGARPKPTKQWDSEEDDTKGYRIKHMCESELREFIAEATLRALEKLQK